MRSRAKDARVPGLKPKHTRSVVRVGARSRVIYAIEIARSISFLNSSQGKRAAERKGKLMRHSFWIVSEHTVTHSSVRAHVQLCSGARHTYAKLVQAPAHSSNNPACIIYGHSAAAAALLVHAAPALGYLQACGLVGVSSPVPV